MEPLTSASVPRRRWALYALGTLALLSGPAVLATGISAVTSVITWPLTGEIAVSSNDYEIFNAELLLVYLIAAMGLNLVHRAGLISIGHGAFFAIGAYLCAISTTTWGWSFYLALVVTIGVCAALGVLAALPALRLGLFTLAMVTVGYAYVVPELALEWRDLTGGGDGIFGIGYPAGIDDLNQYYWLLAGCTALGFALCLSLLRSPFGRAGAAVEASPVVAQSLGIDPTRVRISAFVASVVLAGVAGALYAPLMGFIAPDSFTVQLSILLLLMVLIGGGGTVAGPVIGALLLFRLPIEVQRVTDQPGFWSLLVYGVILLVTVHVLPKGVMSAWWYVQGRLRHTAAGRPADAGAGDEDGAPTAALTVNLGAVISTVAQSGPLLDVRNVKKTVNGVAALQGVSLAVTPGTVHALIGPNGAGKSTLLNVVSGLATADSGEVLLGGISAPRSASARTRAGVGRTFQTPFVFENMTCVENILVALDVRRSSNGLSYLLRLPAARREEHEHVHEATRILDAAGLAHRSVGAADGLPPGEQRMIELARVVAMRPRLVLMDEPAAGLNAHEITELGRAIEGMREAGIGVLLVEHHVDFVLGIADTVTVIDFGKVIAAGEPDTIRDDPRVIEAYLGRATETENQTEPGLTGSQEMEQA